MPEKIQSMTGKHVRVKREYIKSYALPHDQDEEEEREEKIKYFVADENGHEVLDFETLDPYEVLEVEFDFYGVDLRDYTQGRAPYEVNTKDIKHMLKVKFVGYKHQIYRYYEAKYFEVVVPVTTWVRSENFYNNKYMGCDSDYR
jgi:hypothetical protein